MKEIVGRMENGRLVRVEPAYFPDLYGLTPWEFSEKGLIVFREGDGTRWVSEGVFIHNIRELSGDKLYRVETHEGSVARVVEEASKQEIFLGAGIGEQIVREYDCTAGWTKDTVRSLLFRRASQPIVQSRTTMTPVDLPDQYAILPRLEKPSHLTDHDPNGHKGVEAVVEHAGVVEAAKQDIDNVRADPSTSLRAGNTVSGSVRQKKNANRIHRKEAGMVRSIQISVKKVPRKGVAPVVEVKSGKPDDTLVVERINKGSEGYLIKGSQGYLIELDQAGRIRQIVSEAGGNIPLDSDTGRRLVNEFNETNGFRRPAPSGRRRFRKVE